MDADRLLARLCAGDPIAERTAVVVAHPDDETIGMGGRLDRFIDLTLITATDGSPLDMGDARREGFSTREAYAQAREQEQVSALAALGASPRLVRLGVADQGAVDAVADLAARLQDTLVDAALVFTHAYEGGHPDHDACALAVQHACTQMGGRAPVRLEFASYHAQAGAMVAHRFWPDPASPDTSARLSLHDIARKAQALSQYVTQADVVRHFSPEREAYRLAPTYDFTRPPPPGAWLYDGFGFELDGRLWLERAAAACRDLAA